MKKWIFMLLLAGSIQGVYAQKTEKKDKFNPNTPLFEELTDVKKKTDKFNLYLNMQGSFDAHFQNGFQEGDFNMHQLRIEAKGNINRQNAPIAVSNIAIKVFTGYRKIYKNMERNQNQK